MIYLSYDLVTAEDTIHYRYTHPVKVIDISIHPLHSVVLSLDLQANLQFHSLPERTLLLQIDHYSNLHSQPEKHRHISRAMFNPDGHLVTLVGDDKIYLYSLIDNSHLEINSPG